MGNLAHFEHKTTLFNMDNTTFSLTSGGSCYRAPLTPLTLTIALDSGPGEATVVKLTVRMLWRESTPHTSRIWGENLWNQYSHLPWLLLASMTGGVLRYIFFKIYTEMYTFVIKLPVSHKSWRVLNILLIHPLFSKFGRDQSPLVNALRDL